VSKIIMSQNLARYFSQTVGPQVHDAGIEAAVIGVSDTEGLNKSDDFREVSIAVGPCWASRRLCRSVQTPTAGLSLATAVRMTTTGSCDRAGGLLWPISIRTRHRKYRWTAGAKSLFDTYMTAISRTAWPVAVGSKTRS